LENAWGKRVRILILHLRLQGEQWGLVNLPVNLSDQMTGKWLFGPENAKMRCMLPDEINAKIENQKP
jgi:hypothetical protein